MPKATKLSEFSLFCMPSPLDEKTWDAQYVETDPARGGHNVEHLIRRLKEVHVKPEPVKALFSGHWGSGKSTELFRVGKELGTEHYLVDATKIDERYSLHSIDYRLILYYCVTRLIEVAEQNKVDLDKKIEEGLFSWFDKKIIEETKQEGHKISAEAGAKISVWKSFFAKASGAMYSGGEKKEQISKYIEDRQNDILLDMKTVVDAINKQIAPKKLLLILDGLDRIQDRDQARNIFFTHSLQLLRIPCSIIFTFPISLCYDPEAGMHNYFIRYTLPMIPISDAPPGGDLSSAEKKLKTVQGCDILKKIVYQRIDPNASLIDPDALDLMIKKSGGLIRDLLYMLGEAALSAEISGCDKISIKDAGDAVRRLRDDYANRISSAPKLLIDDIEPSLGKISSWPKRKLQQNDVIKGLLQNLCILEYNGDKWYDLHPLVRDYLEIENAESKNTKTKKSSKKKK